MRSIIAGNDRFVQSPKMKLKAQGLVKKFGWSVALDQLSFAANPGEIIAILGENGAGKTSLLAALSGTLRLDEGEVWFDSEELTRDRSDLRRRVAFIPDLPPVPPGWTPLRFIGSLLKLYETPRDGIEEKVLALLTELDLLGVATWRFQRLSRGQAYKAVLAGFIAADPELWLIDEPFASGMDPRGLQRFQEYARDATKRGRTIIFTTQIIEVAERLASRICILQKGKITADAAPNEFRQTAGYGELVKQFSDPVA